MPSPLDILDQSPSDDEDESDPDQPGIADIDPVIRRAFVKLVLVINVGALAAALGVLFLVFRGNYVYAAAIGVPGFALLAYAAYEYRRVTDYRDDRD